MTENAIVVINARKKFGFITALDGVSLAIPRGSVYCLFGPNGSGKTTLLNAIAGLLKLDSGSVQVKGKIGFARQTPVLCEDLTVKENLDFFGKICGERDSRKHLIKTLGLHGVLDSFASNLSVGMRKRLEIAVALLPDPDAILLDEPTTGVDAQTTEKIIDFISELKKKGKTVVIATHQTGDVKKLCGFHGIMTAGKLALSRPRS